MTSKIKLPKTSWDPDISQVGIITVCNHSSPPQHLVDLKEPWWKSHRHSLSSYPWLCTVPHCSVWLVSLHDTVTTLHSSLWLAKDFPLMHLLTQSAQCDSQRFCFLIMVPLTWKGLSSSDPQRGVMVWWLWQGEVLGGVVESGKFWGDRYE